MRKRQVKPDSSGDLGLPGEHCLVIKPRDAIPEHGKGIAEAGDAEALEQGSAC